jgi:hypothetical protein
VLWPAKGQDVEGELCMLASPQSCSSYVVVNDQVFSLLTQERSKRCGDVYLIVQSHRNLNLSHWYVTYTNKKKIVTTRSLLGVDYRQVAGVIRSLSMYCIIDPF